MNSRRHRISMSVRNFSSDPRPQNHFKWGFGQNTWSRQKFLSGPSDYNFRPIFSKNRFWCNDFLGVRVKMWCQCTRVVLRAYLFYGINITSNDHISHQNKSDWNWERIWWRYTFLQKMKRKDSKQHQIWEIFLRVFKKNVIFWPSRKISEISITSEKTSFSRGWFFRKQQKQQCCFFVAPCCFFQKKNVLMGHVSDLNKKGVGDIFVEISYLLSV